MSSLVNITQSLLESFENHQSLDIFKLKNIHLGLNSFISRAVPAVEAADLQPHEQAGGLAQQSRLLPHQPGAGGAGAGATT